MKEQRCSLVLSNGQKFEGKLIGAHKSSSGELVFTTGMVGYSEALTDPSYFGQILLFTYPLIGNYGIPAAPTSFDPLQFRGFESSKVHARGVIISEDSSHSYHWTSTHILDSWLKEQNIVGISGIDTRHLVTLVREQAPLYAKIVPESESPDALSFYDPNSEQILTQVSLEKPLLLGQKSGQKKKRIVVVDCGVKWNILRQLLENDVELQIVPWNADLSQVDASGFLLSNGPGNPQKADTLIQNVKKLLANDRPILGICLGHQILALASGARTIKLRYGHRSHNQPVYEVGTFRGAMTSQNHGFVVEESSLQTGWIPWFRNANDETCEGIRHEKKPFRSVQFHPEAAGGPRDTSWIIEQFIAEI